MFRSVWFDGFVVLRLVLMCHTRIHSDISAYFCWLNCMFRSFSFLKSLLVGSVSFTFFDFFGSECKCFWLNGNLPTLRYWFRFRWHILIQRSKSIQDFSLFFDCFRFVLDSHSPLLSFRSVPYISFQIDWFVYSGSFMRKRAKSSNTMLSSSSA